MKTPTFPPPKPEELEDKLTAAENKLSRAQTKIEKLQEEKEIVTNLAKRAERMLLEQPPPPKEEGTTLTASRLSVLTDPPSLMSTVLLLRANALATSSYVYSLGKIRALCGYRFRFSAGLALRLVLLLWGSGLIFASATMGGASTEASCTTVFSAREAKNAFRVVTFWA